MSEKLINKYKLNKQYPSKLDKFIKELDNNTKKDIDKWELR